MLGEDVINYHQIKDEYFKSKGIELLHIKEEDWMEDKQGCIERCVEFLEIDIMFGTIYKITNIINSKVYIGQTKKAITVRFKEHSINKTKSAISNAIQKYGKENFEVKVLTYCNSMKEMNHREEYYIKLFNTLSPNGYNLRAGGNNSTCSDETKAKISKAKKGISHSHSEETKRKIGLANRKRKLSEYTKQKIANSRLGKKASIKTKLKMSKSKEGNKNHFFGSAHTQEARLKISKANDSRKIKILCFQNSKIYNSIHDAARDLHLDVANIARVVHNKQKQIKGYTFQRV